MQYNNNNIFAKILRGEQECNKVYENSHILAFHDLYPRAPIHILVIPKRRYISFDDFSQNASNIEVISFFNSIKEVINKLNLTKCGYRLITNHGESAGQVIFHFHMHILSKGNSKNRDIISMSEGI